MNDKPSPETEQPAKSSGKGITLALLAGVFGLAVGAGLYAFSGTDDNKLSGSQVAQGETAQAGCVVDQALRTKLDDNASGHVAAFKAIDRPYSVASFEFKDVDGKTRSLSDWKGRTVLMNLWATWCAPCRAEMPALEALNRELGGEKFEVVPISVDLGDPGKPKKFYDDIGLKDVGFFHDGEFKTLTALKKDGLAFGLPATVLINREGCILGTLNGPAEWAGEDAKRLVKTAF